jgi:Holliday junction resolvase RusA-like endonuclease
VTAVKDTPLQFFVRGHPRAQGSKRHVGKGVMVEMAKDLGPWRKAITDEAIKAANGTKLFSPLRVRVIFFFNRPAGHYGTGRNAGNLKPSAPKYREQNPDLDKLLRALFDALVVSGVILDDRFIVRVEAEKRYGDPGVLVEVSELE